jgi:hypothetical protein
MIIIITQLEQVVTQWNVISLQLFYGSTIYTPVCLFLQRIIPKSLRDVWPLRYSSQEGHAEGEHVNKGRDTASFCPTLQLLDMSICCVCLGCCAAKFRSSGGTYELPCISVFTFITCMEFVYEAFRLRYKLWEKRGITGQRVVIYICVCGWSWEHPVFFSNGLSAIQHISTEM